MMPGTPTLLLTRDTAIEEGIAGVSWLFHEQPVSQCYDEMLCWWCSRLRRDGCCDRDNGGDGFAVLVLMTVTAMMTVMMVVVTRR